MSDKLDLSLDQIIVKEGIVVSKPQFSAASDNKTNDNKRKNRFEDMDSDETRVAKKVFNNQNDIPQNRGLHFDSNCGSIFVDNLKYEVVDEDMKQLFGAFGALKRSAVNYQRDGRSAGSAFVVFERSSDALSAYKSLQNITLDGRPLQLILIDGKTTSNDESIGRSVGNLNSRLKSQPKESSVGCSGRELWTEIAKNLDSNCKEENLNYRNKRFTNIIDTKSKSKEVFSAEELDADLESYLSQRKKD